MDLNGNKKEIYWDFKTQEMWNGLGAKYKANYIDNINYYLNKWIINVWKYLIEIMFQMKKEV